jgi:UDP-N-acetylglucosamine 1-carboxyvinyltransferase
MQSFVIEGGYRLSGTVRAAGNKNGALPILAATLLQEPVTLVNVPRIRDVETMRRAAGRSRHGRRLDKAERGACPHR